MSSLLITDVDGVLLKYTESFLKYAGSSLKESDIHNYDMREVFSNVEDKSIMIHSFYRTEEFGKLAPYAGVADALGNLIEKTDTDVVALTQVHPDGYEARMRNLDKEFLCLFDEDNVLFVDTSQDKMKVIRKAMQTNSRVYVIEDHPVLLQELDYLIQHTVRETGECNLSVFGVIHNYNLEALLKCEVVIPVLGTATALALICNEEVNGKTELRGTA